MAGRPRTRARRENGEAPAPRKSRKDFERKSPETIRAEQESYKAMVLGFLEELSEDGDAWQVVVNVCNLWGTSISENNLVLMMAQYAGFSAPNLPPSPFGEDGHVPSDVRHFHAWRKAGRIPRKGMGVKMWEPVRKDIDDPEEGKARHAAGEKGIRWDADRSKWIKLTFKLGTRWDIAHTDVIDADAWAASDPRPAREGGAELAGKIADSIFELFGVDVTIPPTPAEQAATRKRRAERPATPRKPAAKDDAVEFTPPTRRESRPLFGPAPTTPPTPPTGGGDTPPETKSQAAQEGPARAPETAPRALPAGGEGDRPGDDAPTGQDEAFAFLRASGYRGNWATMSKAAYLDLINAAIMRAEDATKGKLWSAAGHKSTATRHDLWTMPESKARKLASEELIAWWAVNGRTTVAEYRADLINGSGRTHRAASGL